MDSQKDRKVFSPRPRQTKLLFGLVCSYWFVDTNTNGSISGNWLHNSHRIAWMAAFRTKAFETVSHNNFITKGEITFEYPAYVNPLTNATAHCVEDEVILLV